MDSDAQGAAQEVSKTGDFSVVRIPSDFLFVITVVKTSTGVPRYLRQHSLPLCSSPLASASCRSRLCFNVERPLSFDATDCSWPIVSVQRRSADDSNRCWAIICRISSMGRFGPKAPHLYPSSESPLTPPPPDCAPCSSLHTAPHPLSPAACPSSRSAAGSG